MERSEQWMNRKDVGRAKHSSEYSHGMNWGESKIVGKDRGEGS